MRNRLTITLDDSILKRVDDYIDGTRIRNRSHAIEFLLNKALYTSMTQAVILAGGTKSKVMLSVGQAPLLEHLIRHLVQSGISEIILCISKADTAIKTYFEDGKRFGAQITYSEEREVMGTGGALRNAARHIESSPFLVIHGDLFTTIDIKDLLSFHVQNGEMVTMTLKIESNVRQYGQITMRGTKVTKFYVESPHDVRSNMVNAGIYVMNRDILQLLSKHQPSSLESFVQNFITAGKVAGYVFDGIWTDASTPSEYEAAMGKR